MSGPEIKISQSVSLQIGRQTGDIDGAGFICEELLTFGFDDEIKKSYCVVLIAMLSAFSDWRTVIQQPKKTVKASYYKLFVRKVETLHSVHFQFEDYRL